MVDRLKSDMSQARGLAGDGDRTGSDSGGRDGLIAAAIGGLIVVTVLIGGLAPAAPPHRAASAPGDDAACAEWSDGCRVCQRVGEGIACSLPGIACVAAAPRCERRVGE